MDGVMRQEAPGRMHDTTEAGVWGDDLPQRAVTPMLACVISHMLYLWVRIAVLSKLTGLLLAAIAAQVVFTGIRSFLR